MNDIKYMPLVRFVLVAVCVGLSDIGCKKHTAPPPPPATASDTIAAPAAAAAGVPAPAPALTTAEQANIDARVAAAKAAMQTKDYAKAQAALFVPMNRQAPTPMTGQQLMSLNQVKAAYLNQLTAAAAAGDAKAKATLQSIQQQQYR